MRFIIQNLALLLLLCISCKKSELKESNRVDTQIKIDKTPLKCNTLNIKKKTFYMTFVSGKEELNIIDPNLKFIPDSITVSFNTLKCRSLNEWNKANYFNFDEKKYSDLKNRNSKIFQKLRFGIKSYGAYLVNEKKITFPIIGGLDNFKTKDSADVYVDFIILNIYKKECKYNIAPLILNVTETK